MPIYIIITLGVNNDTDVKTDDHCFAGAFLLNDYGN